MPLELELKIALEHTRTTKMSWRFLILFTMSLWCV